MKRYIYIEREGKPITGYGALLGAKAVYDELKRAGYNTDVPEGVQPLVFVKQHDGALFIEVYDLAMPSKDFFDKVMERLDAISIWQEARQ